MIFLKFLLLLFSTSVSLQENNSSKNINNIDKRAHDICIDTDNELFCISYDFYTKKEYDSCYIYSSKALLTYSSNSEKDLLNYIQGYSALYKKLYKKALENITTISTDSIYTNLKNFHLGYIHLQLENYLKSKDHYNNWLKNSSTESDRSKSTVYHNLGILNHYLKKHDKAEYYFKEEIKIIKQKQDTAVYIQSINDLANLYYNQYKDKQAIPLFIEAYELATSYSNIKLKAATAENMAFVEKNRKNYKKSVDYLFESNNWKDSIYNQDKIWELTEKDKKIAIAQKEVEIVLEKEKVKRQKLQRNGFIIGSSLLLIFLIILWFFYKQRTAQNKLITQQKEDLKVANKTKNYLFSVVSHDLRSPIHTLNKLHKRLLRHVKNENLEEIKDTTHKAIFLTDSTYKLLNNVLNWSLEQNNQMVFVPTEYPLKNLIEQVLFDFDNLAKAKNITLNNSLISVTITADIESLKIVLRNLIDNSLKYTKDGGAIFVACGTNEQNQNFISIEDNGKGMTKDVLDKIRNLNDLSIDKIDRAQGVGLGMILCQTLVKKNKGDLIIESILDKGTKITILLS